MRLTFRPAETVYASGNAAVAVPTAETKTTGIMGADYYMCGLSKENYEASLRSKDAFVSICTAHGTKIPPGTKATKTSANWSGGCEFMMLDGALANQRFWGPCSWLQ